jgi:UDP-N-acetylmuramyl pentapeptide phosphotransferase/UDP-N-acetylglucosamine-1-phosphate transferase
MTPGRINGRGSETMMTPETLAGIAAAENGLDGVDGLAITFTAEAAAETGRRLIAAAEVAASQPRDDRSGD